MQVLLCLVLVAVVSADPAFHGLGYLTGYHGLGGHDDNIDTTSDDHDNAHEIPGYHGDLPGYHGVGYHAVPYKKAPYTKPLYSNPPVLNCIQRQTDADGNAKESLSVNIKPNDLWGGYGLGMDDGHGGLAAQVNVFSSTGAPVTIAITENANGACEGDKYGNFYGSALALPGYAGHGYGHWGYKPQSPSVIAKTTIHSSQLAAFHVDRIVGFSTLSELAGRGVIVCPTDSVTVGYNGKTYCAGAGKSCCALHYAHEEEHIGA